MDHKEVWKRKVGSDGDMDLEKNNKDELDWEEKEKHNLARNRWKKKHHYEYYEKENVTLQTSDKTQRFYYKHLGGEDYG